MLFASVFTVEHQGKFQGVTDVLEIQVNINGIYPMGEPKASSELIELKRRIQRKFPRPSTDMEILDNLIKRVQQLESDNSMYEAEEYNRQISGE